LIKGGGPWVGIHGHLRVRTGSQDLPADPYIILAITKIFLSSIFAEMVKKVYRPQVYMAMRTVMNVPGIVERE